MLSKEKLLVASLLPLSFATSSATADTLIPLTNAKAISAGLFHVCALLNSSEVACWGENDYGQLGNGTTVDSNTAVVVPELSGVVAIDAGLHTCALLDTGKVKCWGYNLEGELGDGTTVNSSIPVTVVNLSGATAITVGTDSSCALLNTGKVQCWGYNNAWRLCQGDHIEFSPVPITVPELDGVTAIGAGSVDVCAILNTSNVKCWGGSYYSERVHPQFETRLDSIVAISMGWQRPYGILSTGEIKGINFQSSGQIIVDGLNSDVITISAAELHSCALLNTGEVKCWGDNSVGQLGDGTTNSPNGNAYYTDHYTSVTVKGLNSKATTVTTASWEDAHSCATLDTGHVQCWGGNSYGQLGNGTKTNSLTPVLVMVAQPDEKAYTAFGALLGKTGKKLGGATIHLGDKTAITAADGSWSINDLSPGKYEIVATKANESCLVSEVEILDNGQYQQKVNYACDLVTYGDSNASYIAIWQSVAGELEYVDTVTVQAFDAKFQEGLDYKVVENKGEYLLEGIDDAGNTTSKIQVVRISK